MESTLLAFYLLLKPLEFVNESYLYRERIEVLRI